MFSAKVIEHSISPHNVQLPSWELCYPRFIHSEVMTHRVFSRNAMSSRAVPVAKMLEQVRNNPAKPVHWGKNQPGMQAAAELDPDARAAVQALWTDAAEAAAEIAANMAALGAHKQIVNRILEPFQWMKTIITATEWSNFYELRDHEDAQPEFRHLVREHMLPALAASSPVFRATDYTDGYNWHLPYVTRIERDEFRWQPRLLAKLSAARCARVSYLTHESKVPNIDDDWKLFDRLVGSRPMHASPVEHQAYPASNPFDRSGNFIGWDQHRELVELDARVRSPS